MMKKLCSCLLALLLMLGACAIAEAPVLLWEGEDIEAFDTPAAAVTVYSYPDGYGLMSLDGQVIVPAQYGRVTNTDCADGYFIIIKANEINGAALIDLTGAAVTVDTYGDIEMLSEDWVIAVKLELAPGEEYDYWAFGSSDHYNISSVDVYYLPAGGKVVTLSRADYLSAVVHGDHLLVRNREGGVQLYDASLTPVTSEFTHIGEDAFYRTHKDLERDLVVSRITGETIASGYSYVDDVYYDKYISVSNDDDLRGLIDPTGAVLLPCEYDDMEEALGYLQLEQNDMIGLYDLEKQAIVVPCEYTEVLTPDYDFVNFNGYFLLEKDGKVGYVAEGGAATTDFTHDRSAMTLLGCTMFSDNGDGTFTLVAADGVVTALNGIHAVYDTFNASLGHYIIAENTEDKWGIIDWHGNQVVDFCMDAAYSFQFADATHLIVDEAYVYELK